MSRTGAPGAVRAALAILAICVVPSGPLSRLNSRLTGAHFYVRFRCCYV